MAVDSERLTGHGPEQPTIVYPFLNGRVGLDELQRSIPTSTILWLYWLHAYHPSFTYLNSIMTCRPSHSSFCLVIFQGFYWLSEKTLIQQMIITHFVCIELEHKAANASEENTQSSSVKAFYLFICSHAVYKPMSIIIR